MPAAKLTVDEAIEIFLSRKSSSARDGASAALAQQYGITMKAVRDVWNLRTWAWDTQPFWTRRDEEKFLRKHLCSACKMRGVSSLASACNTCAKPRRRGRPRSDIGASSRSDAESELAWASASQGQLFTLDPCPEPVPQTRHTTTRQASSSETSTFVPPLEDPFANDFMPTRASVPRSLRYGGREVPSAQFEVLRAFASPDQPSPFYFNQGTQGEIFYGQGQGHASSAVVYTPQPAHWGIHGPVHPTINFDEQTSNHFHCPQASMSNSMYSCASTAWPGSGPSSLLV